MTREPQPDREVELLIPEGDTAAPELSIVIPALNEELTMADFVAWCQEGLAAAGVAGEILIVDSGDDRSTEIALAMGARVLRTPRRGLGRAYIDALPFIRGRWVIMGDADCTYDFRNLAPFIEAFRDGNEFVMGSRWKGSIEPGSMPPLHQYLGTPVTTKILNVLFSSHFTDIHCGMRGITRDALLRMGLASQSWEYASEMVLKSVHMGLRTTEVPVHFLKDRDGRQSHLKQAGWSGPWKAAWINLRAMFVYGVDFFALKPGLLMLFLGLLISVPLALGPITIGPITFSIFWMLAGVFLALVGLQAFFLGVVAQTLLDRRGAARERWVKTFAYTRVAIASGVTFMVGLVALSFLVIDYVTSGLALEFSNAWENHLAVFGLLLVALSFIAFTSMLLLHAVAANVSARDKPVRIVEEAGHL